MHSSEMYSSLMEFIAKSNSSEMLMPMMDPNATNAGNMSSGNFSSIEALMYGLTMAPNKSVICKYVTI